MDRVRLDIDFYEKNEEFYFDLQRFASADSEGRTEKASEHKKKKAREEGRVALSKELPSAVITIAAFGVVVILGKYVYRIIRESFCFVFENYHNLSVANPRLYYDVLLKPSAKIFIPMAGMAFIIALITNYGQIGGVKFFSKPLKPDFKRVNPNIFKFLKKQVFSMTGAFNLLKSSIKVIIICAVAFLIVKKNLHEILLLADYESLYEAFIFLIKICIEIIFDVMILILIFSIADILFVKWQYEEELKMKKEEVKQEYKDLEGDPQVKSKIKEMYRSLLTQRKMLDEVLKADVVITNPTHFAVALRYDQNVDHAPRVIAKGKDKFAQEIKKVAKENDIYLYENVPLARKLYAEVEINEFVPEDLFALVVIAYKFAYQHKNRLKEAQGV